MENVLVRLGLARLPLAPSATTTCPYDRVAAVLSLISGTTVPLGAVKVIVLGEPADPPPRLSPDRLTLTLPTRPAMLLAGIVRLVFEETAEAMISCV